MAARDRLDWPENKKKISFPESLFLGFLFWVRFLFTLKIILEFSFHSKFYSTYNLICATWSHILK